MLSIAKLRVGAEAYQLTGVAQSLADYYSGKGEAAGWWAGHGAVQLGLGGEVAGGDLRAVLAGIDPRAGGLTPNGEALRVHRNRVPGFDLTFKAPKSVSVLYAVTDDPRVQGAIIDAYEAAVRDTLGWLEREVIAVRRGTGNARFLADLAVRDPAVAAAARQRVLPGGEMAAAVFRHRTSRAGDPLLHWHALVPNLVLGGDGRWSAFVHPDLYRAVRTAGEVFQAAGRHNLTAALGIDWRAGRHVPEVAGVPQGLLDRFSKRSAQIQAYLDATGTPADPAGRQAAVLATRRGKPELEGERLDAGWKDEALEYGWGPAHAEALLFGRTPTVEPQLDERWRLPEVSFEPDGTPYTHDRVVTAEEWISDLLCRDLVARDATFARNDVVRAVAARLGDGASVATIERITARTLASPQLLPIHHTGGQSRWTSVHHAAVERRVFDAYALRDTHTPLPAAAVDQAIGVRPALGEDQAAAVRLLCGSTDAVSVLIGPAGTGKTFTLDAVRHAFETAGYHVIGAAPTAKGGLELEAGAHISSRTLHSLVRRWTNGIDLPGPDTVVVIDEAGMAGTRDLDTIITPAVAAGARVILAGDHRQLPEIEAGGSLAAAITAPRTTGTFTGPAADGGRVRSVAELTVNRRQHHDWEQAALAHLRNGSVPDAVAAYRNHDRVIPVEDRNDMIREAVARWLDAFDQQAHVVLMAGTNTLVDELNQAVRAELIDRGELPVTPIARLAGVDVVAGERLMLRSNHTTPAGVYLANGQTATLLDTTPTGALVVIREGDTRPVEIPADYATAGNVTLAYARTTHRAQGGSWQIGIGVGLDGLYRESAYTQLSRAATENWLILTQPELAAVDAELARHNTGIPLPSEEPDPLDDQLIDRFSRTGAKTMALVDDPHAEAVAALAATWTLTDLELRLSYVDTITRHAIDLIGIDPDTLGDAVIRAQHTAEHIAVGRRVKAHDRHNIGTVVGLDDIGAKVLVHFEADDGRHATRTLHWTLVEILDPDPPARHLPATARAQLDRLLADAAETIRTYENHLITRGVGLLEARHTHHARELLIDRATHQLTAHPPDWLNTMLGTRPETPSAAATWDHGVRETATLRLRLELPNDTLGIGPPPHDPAARRHWDTVARQLIEAGTLLASTATSERWPVRRRSRSELQARLTDLDAILATAPPDQRDLIDRLRSGQLSLDDATQALQDALAGQHERRQWILTHWPHVVEHTQITTTLAAGTWGPDLYPVLRHVADTAAGALADAARREEPWLITAISELASADDVVGDGIVAGLHAIAKYRERWNIHHIQPLGTGPTSPHQAIEYDRIVIDLDERAREFGARPLQIESSPIRGVDADDQAVGLEL